MTKRLATQLMAAGVAPLDADTIVELTKNVQDMYVMHRLLSDRWATGGLGNAKREAVLDWWNQPAVPLQYKRLLTASEV